MVRGTGFKVQLPSAFTTTITTALTLTPTTISLTAQPTTTISSATKPPATKPPATNPRYAFGNAHQVELSLLIASPLAAAGWPCWCSCLAA